MSWKLKTAVVVVLILAMGALLLRLAPVMSPIKDGDSASFWYFACQVQIGEEPPSHSGGIYLPHDGWFIYYLQGFHGQFLYRVPASVALEDFPRVVQELEAAGPFEFTPENEGFQQWLRTDPGRTDAPALLAKIQEARFNILAEHLTPALERVREEIGFEQRWERIRRYPLNQLLEFLFLAALILFAAWPWLRNAGRVTWAVHAALLPWLLFLPYFLGYAQYSFTSVGPSGGVLYPWIIYWFRGLPGTPLDPLILKALPPVLEPLSQTPGPMLSLSGGGLGPTAVLAMGSALGLAVYGIRSLVNSPGPRSQPAPSGTSKPGP